MLLIEKINRINQEAIGKIDSSHLELLEGFIEGSVNVSIKKLSPFGILLDS